MQASLIVPVYNAETTLWPLYDRIDRQARMFDLDFEIVFVDDASTDGSLAVLRDIERSSTKVVVVANSVNRGQGNATLVGAGVARHDILVTLDDDLQHQPEDIPRLLTLFERGDAATLVMGIFDARRRVLWRTVVAIAANAISNLFLDKPLPFRLTTFCVFSKALCRSIPCSENGVALITELVQAADRTVTVPLSVSCDVPQPGNYTIRALIGLFLSRSRVYRLKRVLLWLSACLILFAAATGALLVSQGLPSLFAGALWLVSCVTALLLAALVVRLRRQASTVSRSHGSTA